MRPLASVTIGLPGLAELDRRHGGAEPQRDVAVAEIMHELLDQLLVDEVEESRTRLDQRHGDVERAENRRIFDADDAGPDDREAARQLLQIDDLVAVEDIDAVEGHIVGPERTRAAGDQHIRRRMHARFAAIARDLDLMGADETRLAPPRPDGVPAELMLQHLDLMIERLVHAHHQIAGFDLLLDAIGAAVKSALAPARKVQHGFAQRLRGNCAGMDRDAADPPAFLDDQHGFAELRPLDCGAPPRRSASDDDHIVIMHATGFVLRKL